MNEWIVDHTAEVLLTVFMLWVSALIVIWMFADRLIDWLGDDIFDEDDER